MYTNFFTINYVEQLTFSKTFVDHLQFEQLIFFCLKVKLLEIQVRQIFFDCQPFSLFLSFARMVSSNNKIVSSRFFWQTNFEQMIMTLSKDNLHLLCSLYFNHSIRGHDHLLEIRLLKKSARHDFIIA